MFDDAFADSFEFDVLDATKLIPEEQVPVRIVGRLVLDRMVDNFFAETEQVAFCTQNIVPGIDFTNDPLLQGRNFSYLDTQTKRLGGPNFTHIPINAPKCPFHHFQQDGHMAMHNPKGRANYEPNSWTQGGPRAEPKQGFQSIAERVQGDKRRVRAEAFADHYSQARQFYLSQTEVEQDHIANAIVFELSKVEVPGIRERIVSHLLNVDMGLAQDVADGLGLETLPEAADPAKAPIDLPISDKLSILKNGPGRFEGRKLGLLVTDGADADLVNGLMEAVEKADGMVEVVAPKVFGVTLSDGSRLAAQQKIDGGPSALYDAVAIIASDEGVDSLKGMHPARIFAADAYAHAKFIALSPAAGALLDAAGITERDEGMVELAGKADAAGFVKTCGALRFWDRMT